MRPIESDGNDQEQMRFRQALSGGLRHLIPGSNMLDAIDFFLTTQSRNRAHFADINP
jgi:hypothetical protein